ncbi:hypothetical protein KDH_69720 [Dictyobacter sp. S3.2.2.5]|uniref:N-acetyltransferase domain-containing protein n=1 Tax=Dictyobacter halimunensis TaxID=3026934 RepID=A0ABQ6G2U6_9CHLR|nr:hypothetical protein KDH_69720 [Dictyobacter sp. S3.2.2.5]
MENAFQDPSAITLASFTAPSPYLEDAVQVYLATWPGDLEKVRAFVARYATYPDFRGQVALVQNRVIGMGFGHRSQAGNWWHDRVATRLGGEHPALQDAWVLVELAVLHEYRSRGVGHALHQTLLRNQPCPRTLLSTEVSNTGARRFYERLGWDYVLTNFQFSEGDQPFVVMSRPAS